MVETETVAVVTAVAVVEEAVGEAEEEAVEEAVYCAEVYCAVSSHHG